MVAVYGHRSRHVVQGDVGPLRLVWGSGQCRLEHGAPNGLVRRPYQRIAEHGDALRQRSIAHIADRPSDLVDVEQRILARHNTDEDGFRIEAQSARSALDEDFGRSSGLTNATRVAGMSTENKTRQFSVTDMEV